jgi:hypothetical protein
MKTAVEWLLNQIENDSDTHFHNINWDKFDELINQAKEIQKKNLYECASFWRGKEYKIEKPFFDQWYNENFKPNEQE